MRRLTSSIALGVAAASFGAQTPAAYAQESASMMQPVGDYPSERLPFNRALFFGGGALFLGAYGTSAIVGVANQREADEKLAIPIAGPWLDLSDRQCDRVTCSNEGLSKSALIASGVLQGVGLVGMISSLFVAERRLQPDRTAERRTAAAPRVRVTPAPLGRGPGSNYGVALVGTF